MRNSLRPFVSQVHTPYRVLLGTMSVLLNLTILAEFNIPVKRSKEKPQLKLIILIGHSSINAPELKNLAS
ncbi:MAG: hypothetical protein QGG38_05605 [Nitrospinaceae bacterium]|nr:hypothetical protein [Nitrospinaceae bacterium]HAK38443.1 hypothetical protein [Nitrospina sp.]|tara:strand:+ start:10190 stop:10399 length:210 start_codon:yes stop_codon:yes gene_type:complete